MSEIEISPMVASKLQPNSIKDRRSTLKVMEESNVVNLNIVDSNFNENVVPLRKKIISRSKRQASE